MLAATSPHGWGAWIVGLAPFVAASASTVVAYIALRLSRADKRREERREQTQARRAAARVLAAPIVGNVSWGRHPGDERPLFPVQVEWQIHNYSGGPIYNLAPEIRIADSWIARVGTDWLAHPLRETFRVLGDGESTPIIQLVVDILDPSIDERDDATLQRLLPRGVWANTPDQRSEFGLAMTWIDATGSRWSRRSDRSLPVSLSALDDRPSRRNRWQRRRLLREGVPDLVDPRVIRRRW